MMKRIRALGVIALLAAYLPTPTPLAGDVPTAICCRVQDESLAEYDRRAEHCCQQFGRRVQRTSVEPDGETNIAEYACS
jgi:hypothetical protein